MTRSLKQIAFALAMAALVLPANCTWAFPVKVDSKESASGDAESRKLAMKNPNRMKIGLALGGGGGRGAAHVGVLKVLQEENVPIDFVCGTSIGSVVGGLYASGVPLSKIENLVLDKHIMRAYYSMPVPLRMSLLPLDLIPRGLGIHRLVGLNKGDKFGRFIEKNLPEGCTQIENTQIPFSCVTTDLITGDPYVLSSGSMCKAIQASSAVPFLKKPVELNGKYLADGFINGSNLPIRECRAMGADLVICINIDGPVKSVPIKNLHHTRPYRHQIANIVLRTLDVERAKEADLLISPDVSEMRLLTASHSDIKKAMDAGERAAREALPQIRALVERASNERQAQRPNGLQL